MNGAEVKTIAILKFLGQPKILNNQYSYVEIKLNTVFYTTESKRYNKDKKPLNFIYIKD